VHFFSLFVVLSSILKELYHEEILKKYQFKILKECINDTANTKGGTDGET